MELPALRVFPVEWEAHDTAYADLDCGAIVDYMSEVGWVKAGVDCCLVCLGCGCAKTETNLVETMFERGYSVESLVLLDRDLRSSAVKNVQDLLQRHRHVAAYMVNSYKDLLCCIRLLKEKQIVIVGLHSGLYFRTPVERSEYLQFLLYCHSLAEKQNLQLHWNNFQLLSRHCIGPTYTVLQTEDDKRASCVCKQTWMDRYERLFRRTVTGHQAPARIGLSPNQLI